MSGSIVPLSLGKPSLRRRLEAYYTLVAPEQLYDNEGGATTTTTARSSSSSSSSPLWRERFEQIYAKYGGTIDGEARLATKLAKKYGATVRLQTVSCVGTKPARSSAARTARAPGDAPFGPGVVGTGVLDFTSEMFDPVATLRATLERVRAANSVVAESSSMMDRVDQCSCLLPKSDPLFRPRVVRTREHPRTKTETGGAPKDRPPPFFSSFVAPFESGPMSILHQAVTLKHRVRVLIRYVDGIRGTTTGFVVAFDKHFNLLLRDAEEVYSPRMPCEGLSNAEMELKRRRLARGIPESVHRDDEHELPAWSCRHRYLKQVLIRGDNVVLVYKADDEKSSWPPTATGATSLYRKRGQLRVPASQRVGTPGSLVVCGSTDPFRSRPKPSYSSKR